MTAGTDMTGRGGPGCEAGGEEGRLRAGPVPEPGRGQLTAVFRYELISGLLEEGLARAERGELMTAICAAEHRGPDGETVTVSPPTVRRWIAAYQGGGFAGLVPQAKGQPSRCPGPVRAAALALKDANPRRTARMVRAIMLDTCRDRPGDVPSERTLQRWFAGLAEEVPEPGISQAAGAFGRYEAPDPMTRWPGDIMYGPLLGGRQTYLHAFIDDHSRAVMAARFSWHADVIALAQVLRQAVTVHGAPAQLHVDNGSCYVDAWLRRACGVLGIQLIHSRPYRPQGRGKIERFFGTVRSQFMPELAPEVLDGMDLAGLNRLLAAWIGEDYSRRVHAGTGQAPADRFAGHLPAGRDFTITPQRLREAFWWSAARTADKATAVIKFFGGRYRVDPALAGRRVEILYDPFDLTVLHIRCKDRDFGTAVPLVIGQHAHPKTAKHDPPAPPPPDPAGPAYLRLLDAAHDRKLSGALNYRHIITPDTTPAAGPEEGR
jgi:putative transposase